MAALDELKELYAKYAEKAEQVRKKASPIAGMFGFGDDPRRHSCHDDFYEAVEHWVADFMDSAPETDEIVAVTRWILEEPNNHQGKECYWYMYAAHGLTSPVIPKLPQDVCSQLRAWYGSTYSVRERMPVQQQVYKLLQKHSGQKCARDSIFQKIFRM
jgi:hypothetical protein